MSIGKIIAVCVAVLSLSACATTVAVVDVTASTAVYATKGVVSTTYDIITWPFTSDEE